MENMAQPNFGEECLEELQKREDAMKSDYRYDIGVFTNCEVRGRCVREREGRGRGGGRGGWRSVWRSCRSGRLR